MIPIEDLFLRIENLNNYSNNQTVVTMKHYLMTGIAALALCIGFTSCSHEIEPTSQEEINAAKAKQIVDNYNKAFIAKFGQPASNQDWGFDNVNASARAFTRAEGKYASKGNLTPTGITFPEDCAASNFDPDIKNIPSYDECCRNAPNASEWWTPDEFPSGVAYIDSVQKVKITSANSGSKLYIKAGTYDFSDTEFNLAEGTEVYLLPGVTLTLNNTAASEAKFTLYIASTSTLIANGANGLKMDNTGKVYNHGTIECSRFEVNNTAFLYNVGKLKSTGDVYIANSTSRIVNDGEIESVSVHVEGSGALQNNAEWTVTGYTIVNCTNGGWVNNGYWQTKNYGYTAGSENVINNCFLEVTDDFDMNISSSNTEASFKIDTGGGVLTRNFYGGKKYGDSNSKSGPYKIVMGHSAVFKVTETATLEGGNPGWGFFGPESGDYAVFQAKNVVRNEDLKNTQGAVTYSGNLYVCAETHFPKGSESDTFIYEDEGENGFKVALNIYAQGFRPGKPGITIQETTCCPGFNGDDDDEFDVRIIGEDLTPGDTDWDFNDVVFGVKYDPAGTSAKCTLLAAGGTLPLRIGKKGLNGNPNLLDENDWVEVHELYHVPTTTMVNTGGISTTIDLKPEFTVTDLVKSENGKDILIYVNKGTVAEPNWIELKAEKGDPAAKLAVKKGFRICVEQQNINENYQRFKDWISNPLIRWY